jgi:hypothetical protein
MSVDFDALFFYGMPIAGDVGWDLIETFDNLNGPIEIANLDSYGDGSYMLFVRESYHSGDKHSEPEFVRLGDVTGKEGEWRQLIVDACIAHAITFVEPDWYFATAFS